MVESSGGRGGGKPAGREPVTGVVAALPAELGPLADGPRLPRSLVGTPIYETRLQRGGRIVAALAGVGKVAAAGAAAALIAEGATRLLVVGTCGGLRAQERVGDLVHASRAVQWDLAVRRGRELMADPDLLASWCAVAGGEEGCILTADRPVIRFLDRLRVARAAGRTFAGPLVADMEAAAVAAVASQAGIPWAALKVISDQRSGWLGALGGAPSGLQGFEEALAMHGARPASTVVSLCEELARRGRP
jgi:adenosylhomocysteine nucleosidase